MCLLFFYSVNVFSSPEPKAQVSFSNRLSSVSVCPYTFHILIFFSRTNGPISTKLGTIILNISITDPCKMTWLCWLQEVFILGLTSNSIYFQRWSWENDMTKLVTEKSSFLPCLMSSIPNYSNPDSNESNTPP